MAKKIKQFERSVRIHLNKKKFLFGLTPCIEQNNEHFRKYIPEPYEAVCLISADFELAWAYRFSKYNKRSKDKAVELGLLTRRNVPVLLKLCENYNIPITWATIGHLFIQSCKKGNGITHPEIKRLPFFENEFWRYDTGDWFEDDPGTDVKNDPAWYCPDLIQQIIDSPVNHEIGSHTFSHIDCRDEVCPTEVFISEMDACRKAAVDFNIELKSFVHPGHQIGNLQNLADLGFTSFRTDYGDSLAFPRLHSSGLWEFRNTCLIDKMKGWSADYHIWRYNTILKRAIKHHKVCVLWFHPSFDPIFPDVILPELFRYIHAVKDKIWITTHQEYVEWLRF